MAAIKPFKIEVSDERLAKLKQRLALTEFPGEPEGAGRRYGAPLADIKRLTDYWQSKFDWRAQERRLNELPHFTTEVTVDGFGPIDIHFVHQKSGVDGAIPLLFVHGWPGSFLEVTKLLPLLKAGDGKPAFDIVAPSLPNYGFSSRMDKPGFNLSKYAEAINKLMLALGYSQYVTQGGDWGHAITQVLSQHYPENCKANHTNFPLSSNAEDIEAIKSSSPTPLEGALLGRAQWFQTEGRGYFAEQSTRPLTLGYSLRDSPVGLLAWIYEKLLDWTDDYAWTDDEVLTWISVYWFSRAGPDASTLIYYEAMHDEGRSLLAGIRAGGVPLALAYFPKELSAMPAEVLKKKGVNVKQVSYFEKGGHFAAWERPEDIAADVCKFYGQGGGAAGVVDGKSG